MRSTSWCSGEWWVSTGCWRRPASPAATRPVTAGTARSRPASGAMPAGCGTACSLTSSWSTSERRRAPASSGGAATSGGEPQAFDICGPLPKGVTLLEASAGTGKTFTIAGLAARYVADGMPLDRLLVVTFTRMATGELRERVRERLVSAAERARRRPRRGCSGPRRRRPPPARAREANRRWSCARTAWPRRSPTSTPPP